MRAALGSLPRARPSPFPGLVDDVLQQSHRASAAASLLVGLEGNWRLLPRPQLEECRLLVVELSQAVLGLEKNLLGGLLVRHDRLELLVLALTVLAGLLLLDVRLRDLRLQHF